MTADQRESLASICAYTRESFLAVFDLVLIHNEQQVSGPQPRTTLNWVIAMLSVRAWERFVADVSHLAESGTARFALTLFLQFVDQSIRALAANGELEQSEELRLPEDWLSGRLHPIRGVTDPDQLALWRGPSLAV